MLKILRAAVVATALIAGGSQAQASCGAGTFDGFYIGGTLGIGRHTAKQFNSLEPDASASSNDFVGGGHVGYNLQCGRFVGGIEADINYAGHSARSVWPDDIEVRSKLDWYGTVRGRLGVLVNDHLMIYGTGGLLYTEVSHRLHDPTPPLAAPPFTQTNKRDETAWVWGGGIEFLHADRWILRAEALHVDLGHEEYEYRLVAGCLTCRGVVRWDDSFWVGRIGLSVKLGHHYQRPVEPLK